jgi:hypothetical protein
LNSLPEQLENAARHARMAHDAVLLPRISDSVYPEMVKKALLTYVTRPETSVLLTMIPSSASFRSTPVGSILIRSVPVRLCMYGSSEETARLLRSRCASHQYFRVVECSLPY